MANMSAAEMLKAELSGAVPVKPNLSLPAKPATTAPGADTFIPPSDPSSLSNGIPPDDDEGVPGFGNHHAITSTSTASLPPPSHDGEAMTVETIPDKSADADANGDVDFDESMNSDAADDSVAGVKRKLSDIDDVVDDSLGDDVDDDAPADVSVLKFKVNADGSVDQPDTVQYVVILLRKAVLKEVV
jgi:hypothetical protein